MNKEKYVFILLTSFLNEEKFRRIIDKYQDNQIYNCLIAMSSIICSSKEALHKS